MRALTYRALIAAVFVVGVGGAVISVSRRLFFPWPLEWMEGAILHHALRLLEGRPIYGPPTAEFIPFLYPPFAYLPIAASVAAFGASLPSARLPSVFALAATSALIARIASRNEGGLWAAALAMGLWSLGYGYGVVFLDLARVDAVFMLLIMAGVERFQAGRVRAALLFFGSSCLTKQPGFFFLAAASAWLLYENHKKNFKNVFGSWSFVAMLFILMHLSTDGWFFAYTIALPASHGIVWKSLAGFFLIDLILLLPLLCAVAAVELWRHRRAPQPVHAMLVAGLCASAMGRAHVGGHENVLLPGFAMLVAVASARIAPILVSAIDRGRLQALVAGALLLQCAVLFQPPTVHWPTDKSNREFRAIVKSLASCASGGSAVAIDHALLTSTPFMHSMALSDLRAGGDKTVARAATRALLGALSGPHAPAALAVGPTFSELDDVLTTYYDICDNPLTPTMTTGYQPSQIAIYKRK